MKVTVCQLSDNPECFIHDWESLVAHVQASSSQLVLLPELPFYPWFACQSSFDPQIWQAAVTTHHEWLKRLPEVAPAIVLGTCPVQVGDLRLNEAFAWEADNGYQPAHTKYYLPDEEGFWEATWYHRGDGIFTPIQLVSLKLGFLVCSELWFGERARVYGKQGIHLVAVPRCTLRATEEKWLVGGRAAAVESGAFCLSSNHISRPHDSLELGGQGWIIGPDGDILGLTSPEQPFVTVDIDLRKAEYAKQTYPRYIQE